MTVRILHGDALEQLRLLADESVHSVVTDPPYLLNFMGKAWDRIADAVILDPGLGHWLAGFADGEGCFTARRSGLGYQCEFIIHLRADDAAILRHIHQVTGIGEIRGPAARADGGSPMVKWVVSRQADCGKLVAIFDAFPLRAKKARDFQIWKRAVQEWMAHEPGDDWAPVADLASMLSSVKKYGAGFNRDQFFHYQWARECLRVLKPGGHLLAFGGSRTYHRLAAGIEDAGFEVRDQIQWLFGSGFPKSLDVSKAIDKANGREFSDRYALGRHMRERREAAGLSRSQVNAWLGATTKCEHYESDSAGFARIPTLADWNVLRERLNLSDEFLPLVERAEAERPIIGKAPWATLNTGPLPGADCSKENRSVKDITAPATESARQWQGWGTALKPAHEPIVVARKPLIGTVAANVLKHGTGAINVDGCRVGTGDDKGIWPVTARRYNDVAYTLLPTETDRTLGRWPANIIHDGSDEVLAGFPETESGNLEPHHNKGGGSLIGTFEIRNRQGEAGSFGGDSGSAARFFYTAKASGDDRNIGSHAEDERNHHPTVKPTDLMQYLVRLVTPPGGTVLDPFAGSGSTGLAADREGFDAILIEREAEYVEIARRRIVGDCPLFAELAA